MGCQTQNNYKTSNINSEKQNCNFSNFRHIIAQIILKMGHNRANIAHFGANTGNYARFGAKRAIYANLAQIAI